MSADDPGTIAKWAGVLMTAAAAYTTAGLALWRNAIGRIRAAEERIDQKADKDRMETIAANLGVAFQNQRADHQEIMLAVRDMTGAFSAFQVDVTKQLGERPTREELRRG